MTQTMSEKIKVMSLWATVMVVYRHSLNYLAFFGTWTAEGFNGFVQDGVMVLTQVAVPYFFLVSGFFFFKHDYYKENAYVGMLLKKAKSLVVPFVIWNLVGLGILLLTRQTIAIDSIWEFISQLAESRFYGPLWYVRDLIVLMILVPLYLWLFKLNKWWLYLAIGAILYYYWIPVDCGWLSSEGLFFFFLGEIISKNEHWLEKRLPRWAVFAMLIVWSGLCFFTPAFQYLHKPCTLLGIVTFWLLMDTCQWLKSAFALKLTQFSFIIYVLHFYPLKVMKVYIGNLFFGNEWVSLACYLLLPLVTCALCVIAGVGLKRWLPRFYRISTGNR